MTTPDSNRPRPRPSPFPSAPPVSLDKPATPAQPGSPPGPPGPPPGYPPMPPPGYGPPMPPAYPPQHGYGMYGVQPWGAPPMSNGLGLTAMILGIVSILTSIIFIGVVPAILAVIFGVIGRGKARRGQADNGGQALAGIICGVVGLVIFILAIVLVVVAGHSSTQTCDSFGNCTSD